LTTKGFHGRSFNLLIPLARRAFQCLSYLSNY
jgi:hypothetical protein